GFATQDAVQPCLHIRDPNTGVTTDLLFFRPIVSINCERPHPAVRRTAVSLGTKRKSHAAHPISQTQAHGTLPAARRQRQRIYYVRQALLPIRPTPQHTRVCSYGPADCERVVALADQSALGGREHSARSGYRGGVLGRCEAAL